MIMYNTVPTDFGKGIVIPLAKNVEENVTDSNNYRGITLSPVISKVFELLIMELAGDKLGSDDLQFGFKANSGCRHAIQMLRTTVNHFCHLDSTVSLCALDISKAFDRVNHYGLMSLLMKRKFPRCLILILLNWFSKCNSMVRWGDALSSSFRISGGVRQGGLLSPALFAVYIDDLVVRLRASGYGSKIKNQYVGCLAYADDLLLLSHSVGALQHMLNICNVYAEDFDVQFNSKKSMAMRIGKRFGMECAPLRIKNCALNYVTFIRYLGVVIVAAKEFKCSYDHVKLRFFRAFNGIHYRSKASNSEPVTVELFKAFCLPFLLYAVEVTAPNKTNIRSLDNCINKCISKTFDMRETSTILEIRSMFQIEHVNSYINRRYSKFIDNLMGHSFLFDAIMDIDFLCCWVHVD